MVGRGEWIFDTDLQDFELASFIVEAAYLQKLYGIRFTGKVDQVVERVFRNKDTAFCRRRRCLSRSLDYAHACNG